MWRSLGKVTVTTSGTPVRATLNETTPSDRVGCQSILFEQIPGNTGRIYICDRQNANIITLVGVVAILAKPTSSAFPSAGCGVPSAPAALNAADFYIDAEISGEGVLVSVVKA
jgi:hypothetical protein